MVFYQIVKMALLISIIINNHQFLPLNNRLPVYFLQLKLTARGTTHGHILQRKHHDLSQEALDFWRGATWALGLVGSVEDFGVGGGGGWWDRVGEVCRLLETGVSQQEPSVLEANGCVVRAVRDEEVRVGIGGVVGRVVLEEWLEVRRHSPIHLHVEVEEEVGAVFLAEDEKLVFVDEAAWEDVETLIHVHY